MHHILSLLASTGLTLTQKECAEYEMSGKAIRAVWWHGLGEKLLFWSTQATTFSPSSVVTASVNEGLSGYVVDMITGTLKSPPQHTHKTQTENPRRGIPLASPDIMISSKSTSLTCAQPRWTRQNKNKRNCSCTPNFVLLTKNTSQHLLLYHKSHSEWEIYNTIIAGRRGAVQMW